MFQVVPLLVSFVFSFLYKIPKCIQAGHYKLAFVITITDRVKYLSTLDHRVQSHHTYLFLLKTVLLQQTQAILTKKISLYDQKIHLILHTSHLHLYLQATRNREHGGV